ncbi:MAG: response regulator [Spirochaetota bacterium]
MDEHMPGEHAYEQSFRQRAENYLEEQGGRLRGYAEYSSEELLHELQVHQIELELQNEELKNSQDRLQQERAKYTALFDLAPVGYFALDKQGYIKEMNYAAEHMLDRKLDTVSGSKFTDYILPGDQDLFYFHFQDILRYGKGKPRELRLIKPDGSSFFVRIQSTTIKAAAEGISIFLAVIDITEMIDVQTRLKAAKVEAETASRAKSQFLANMSHEIRTPMNGILGMLEIAMMTDLPPEQMDHLKLAKSSADNLLSILNDILDLSKIEAKKLSLQSVEFEPAEVVTGAARLLSVSAWRKGVELVAAVDPQLPVKLIGDPVRLKQVLFNFLSNAVKFTDEGEIQIQVLRESGAASGNVRIKFLCRDSGIGIPPQKIDRLFKSFTQADEATTRKYGGTGLGLAISAKLVEMMGGSVHVDSAEGRGSTFSFALDLPVAQASRSTQREQQDFPIKQVLLAEKHELSYRVTKMYLEALDLTVVELPLRKMKPKELAQLKKKIQGTDDTEAGLALLSGTSEELEQLLSQFEQDAFLAQIPVVIACYPPECGDFRGRLAKYKLRRIIEKPVSQSDLRVVIHELFSPNSAQVEQTNETTPDSADVYSPTVLVAEDNDINMRVIDDFFTRREWKLIKCRNGKEAIEQYLSHSGEIDAVLMDIQMPIMDGYDAIKKLRTEAGETGSRVPIIAMTAYAMSSDRERCYRAGADDYITKPIPSMENLAAMIERNINKPGGSNAVEIRRFSAEGAKVVVAEDENINRLFVKRILEKEGYKVFEAKEGESALALVYKELPDMVIIDLKLPKRDGLSIVRELFENQRTATIPILIISGRSAEEIEKEALPQNVSGFVSKPVDSSTLLEYIKSSLNRKVNHEERYRADQRRSSEITEK